MILGQFLKLIMIGIKRKNKFVDYVFQIESIFGGAVEYN